jgi:hypothetical protein
MTLAINQLLDQQGLNDEQPKEEENEETTEDTPRESLCSFGIGVSTLMMSILNNFL